MLLALTLLAGLATTDCPKDDSPAKCEDPALGTMDVCNALTAAAKGPDFDALVGHTTAYARSRFGRKEKLAIEGLHGLLIGVRCVKITQENDTATPPRALIWVYAPEGKSRDMPFVKEHNFWRFDYEQYEAMHGKKK
jgi:hypothetical protein